MRRRLFRSLFNLAAVVPLALVGCAEKRHPSILVQGGQEHRWYDSQELDQIVREYARQNRLNFDFRGTHPQFWVSRDRQYLAEATYSSGVGKPILTARIAWDGHVAEHHVGFAVDTMAAATER